MKPPRGLQLDLATAVLRLEQLRRGGLADGHVSDVVVLDRLLTCDLRRLAGHLTPETLIWIEAAGMTAALPGPETRD